ncbi:hypothetical protein PAMA_012717 [Pampus argenteus]
MSINNTAENLQISKGSTLGSFIVEDFLGEGGFGFVTKCRHTETGRMAAIKVNKPDDDVVKQTREEIEMLKSLRCLDHDTCNIIGWNGFFFARDYICLEFELLDQSLRDYMRNRNYMGLPLTQVKPVLHQLTTALAHLQSMGIVHADLKPDNIMITDRTQQPLKVKLIDFGLARLVSKANPSDCLQTIWYRAPEMILKSLYNEAIDMWSLGLTAAELALGHALYPGQSDYDMLTFIMETQGQPPDYFLNCGDRTMCYFNKQLNSQPQWRFKDPEEFARETGYRGKETRKIKLKSLDDLERKIAMKMKRQRDQHSFNDLVKRMLELDPDHRIQPLEVLQHPFFKVRVPQNPHPTDIQMDQTVPELMMEPNTHQMAGGIRGVATPTEAERETVEAYPCSKTKVAPNTDKGHNKRDHQDGRAPNVVTTRL